MKNLLHDKKPVWGIPTVLIIPGLLFGREEYSVLSTHIRRLRHLNVHSRSNFFSSDCKLCRFENSASNGSVEIVSTTSRVKYGLALTQKTPAKHFTSTTSSFQKILLATSDFVHTSSLEKCCG